MLPARVPNLLLNGTSGIAVGMATNIPPHNLVEICDAISYLIDRYDTLEDVTVEDLMQFVKGPDFPTGAALLGQEGLVNAYATGSGRITMRAMARIEEMKEYATGLWSVKSRSRLTKLPLSNGLRTWSGRKSSKIFRICGTSRIEAASPL